MQGANRDKAASFDKTWRKNIHEYRKTMFVNCWHISEHKSAAMWKLYTQGNEGVAIRSTFGRLMECLRPATVEVFAGKVTYIDYRKQRIPDDNMLFPSMHKRMSFQHEQELRLLYWDTDLAVSYDPTAIVWKEGVCFKKGVAIDVDIGALIDKVFVAPTSQVWFKNLVQSILLEKYRIGTEVRQSDLSLGPLV
jgi:hypothetical protein